MRSAHLGIVVWAVLAPDRRPAAAVGGEKGAQSPAAAAALDASVNPAGTCPATIVVETELGAKSEDGVYYMLGPNPKVDTSTSG